MKKIILLLIVAMSLLSLGSCEDYEEKAANEIQQVQQQDQHIQYKDSGKDEEPDPDDR